MILGGAHRTLSRERIAAVHEVVDRRAVGVAFQPIVDLRRRAVFADDALARNESPEAPRRR